jgi:hypothetical protein
MRKRRMGHGHVAVTRDDHQTTGRPVWRRFLRNQVVGKIKREV